MSLEFVFFVLIQVELNLLRRNFKALANQMDLIFRKKLWFVMLEQFLMKYIWGLTGLVMVAWPILGGRVSVIMLIVIIVINIHVWCSVFDKLIWCINHWPKELLIWHCTVLSLGQMAQLIIIISVTALTTHTHISDTRMYIDSTLWKAIIGMSLRAIKIHLIFQHL